MISLLNSWLLNDMLLFGQLQVQDKSVRSQVARLHSLGNIHKITELASTDLTKIVCRFFLILQGYPSNKFLIIVLSTLTSVSSQTCLQKRSILYCEDACTRIIMRSQAFFCLPLCYKWRQVVQTGPTFMRACVHTLCAA